MSTFSAHAVRIGQVVTAVIVAWIIFAILGDLEPNGQHLMALGFLRMALLAVLVAFAAVAGIRSRMGRIGLGLAAVSAAANLVGGIGAPITDGFGYNPFLSTSSPVTPWYAYVIGASGILFAVGTLLVGVAGRSAGWMGAATILAGVCYPLAYFMQIPLGTETGAVVGHLLWIAPWLALSMGLARDEQGARAVRPVMDEVAARP